MHVVLRPDLWLDREMHGWCKAGLSEQAWEQRSHKLRAA